MAPVLPRVQIIYFLAVLGKRVYIGPIRLFQQLFRCLVKMYNTNRTVLKGATYSLGSKGVIWSFQDK